MQQLKISAEQSGVAIHAFVLMTNHVHLLVTPSTANACAKMMQSLGRKYVQYINLTYRRTGTLEQIRECTNKSWVLGGSKFKAQIESAANRRIESSGWGGDRKSKRIIDQGV